MLVSITSTQFGASVAKGLFPVLGARGVCLARLVVATFLLGLAWRPWRFKPTRPQLRVVAVYGAILGIMNLTYYLALQRLPLGLAVALEFIGPLAVAMFYSRRLIDFVWAVLAVVGILLVLPLTSGAAGISLTGLAFALTAGAAWGLYIVFGKRASGVVHAGVATSFGMLTALIVISPVTVPDLPWMSLIAPRVLLLAVGVGLFSSAFPYSLDMIALKHLPAKNFGILLSLSPAIATLAGLFVLKETLTTLQLIAIGCIFAASLGSALSIDTRMAPSLPIEP